MFCMKCGKELPDDAVFCSACGNPVGEYKKTIDKKSNNKLDILKGSVSDRIRKSPLKIGKINVRVLACSIIVIAIISIIAITIIALVKSKENSAEQGNDDKENTISIAVNNYSSGNDLPDFSEIKAGQYITFGRYEQDNNLDNGAEPIEWQVLAIEDGKALLVSKYVLEIVRFNEYANKQYNNTWETCSLRYWLNDSFYNDAFNDNERNCIISTHIYDEFNGLVQNDVEDKVFCLSIPEILEYYTFDRWVESEMRGEATSKDLVIDSTPYAAQRAGYGRSVITDGYLEQLGYPDSMLGKTGTKWWSRTTTSGGVFDIDAFGRVANLRNQIMNFSSSAYNEGHGVRPALWVSALGAVSGRAYEENQYLVGDKERVEETPDHSEEALSQLLGHYEDGRENTVDIISSEKMIRFIKGGNQSHTYEESICGIRKLDNGYLIMVEWEGEKWTYVYTVNNGVEMLYVNFDEEWNPQLNPYNHMVGLQEYVKKSSSPEYDNASLDENNVSSDNDVMWELEAHDSGMPQKTFDVIKGLYRSEVSGITVEITSTTEAILNDGSETTLIVEGSDAGPDDLDLYVTDPRPNGKGQFILNIVRFDGDYMMLIKEGAGWDYNNARQTASLFRVK